MRALAARSGGAAGVSHDSPRIPNVHVSGFRPSKTKTKFEARTHERGRRMKIVAEEGGGGPVEGCPARGGSLEGSNGRVHWNWGAGFGVSGSVQVFGDENRTKMK